LTPLSGGTAVLTESDGHVNYTTVEAIINVGGLGSGDGNNYSTMSRTFRVTGDVSATGDVIASYSSDARLKRNVKQIVNALDKVLAVRGVEFDWDEQKQTSHSGHDIGVIAQEIQGVAPELVERKKNGYLGVKYDRLTALLIEAIRELSAEVDELRRSR
jgi:hypothetical protein